MSDPVVARLQRMRQCIDTGRRRCLGPGSAAALLDLLEAAMAVADLCEPQDWGTSALGILENPVRLYRTARARFVAEGREGT